jgi:hypothetical protein
LRRHGLGAVLHNRDLHLLCGEAIEFIDPLIESEQQVAFARLLNLMRRITVLRQREFFLSFGDRRVELLDLLLRRRDLVRSVGLGFFERRVGFSARLLEIVEAVLQPFRLDLQERVARNPAEAQRIRNGKIFLSYGAICRRNRAGEWPRNGVATSRTLAVC